MNMPFSEQATINLFIIMGICFIGGVAVTWWNRREEKRLRQREELIRRLKETTDENRARGLL